jgi:hypothetical protein
MHMLWPLYVCWAYASWSDTFTHQFIHFSSVNFGYPQHMQTELMRMLSMRLRSWCLRWAYASETYMCTLSICIRNSYMRWAYESGTRARTEHTMHQELVCALSIRIRNLCLLWAYTSGTYLCMHWAYAQRTYMVAEHTQQFLTRMLSTSVTIPNLKRSFLDMLSIRLRNSCVHWAYTSGTYAYDQREFNWCLVPQELNILKLF